MRAFKFVFVADIATHYPDKIEPVLEGLIGVDGILRTEDGFKIRTTMEGTNARELNRKFFSLLRRGEISATMEAEWVHDGTIERFVDFEPIGLRLVPKGRAASRK